MTNWQIYKAMFAYDCLRSDGSSYQKSYKVCLDKHVEYADGYEKYINLDFWFKENNPCGSIEFYIEIDLDETKCKNSDYSFGGGVWREIPQDLVNTRLSMLNSSSINQTALAINREGMDRVDRGEQATFIYQMEENGIKHSWTYKRN
jgi:hypothetical protein